jgi:Fe2+ or Zn2+ uptake regulation protein
MPELAVGKMTRQRRIVLDAVRAASTHPDACEVYEAARRALPSISLGTVYRTLQTLARAGLIARIETAGSKMRFDANTAAHDHVTCAKCGRVMDTDAAGIEAAKDFVSKATGFEIIGQRVEFTGVCPRCRKRVKGARAARSRREGGLLGRR